MNPGVPGSTAQAMLMASSHQRLVGRPLLSRSPGESDEVLAGRLYTAHFGLLSHDDRPDTCFNYAKLVAQPLFERSWDEMVGMPSRLSAEAPGRAERERFLARVAEHGYVDDYTGIRVAKSGWRFRILRATIWNLLDASGRRVGQAASIPAWEPLG
jgi:hypothetical protein